MGQAVQVMGLMVMLVLILLIRQVLAQQQKLIRFLIPLRAPLNTLVDFAKHKMACEKLI